MRGETQTVRTVPHVSVEGRSAGRWRRGLAGLLVAAATLLVLAPTLLAGVAAADIGDYRCEDPGRVYHGNARLIRKPAAVSADRVYRQIPEYQTILRENLNDNDVRYHFLMKEASKKFSKAVKAMARAKGHDFVAEIGAIEVVKDGAPEPPDRTSEVISRVN